MNEKKFLLALILLSLAGLVLVYFVFLNEDTGGGGMSGGEEGLRATDDDGAQPGDGTGGELPEAEGGTTEKVKLEGTGAVGRGRTGTGVITGRVVDESGAPIEGAVISLGRSGGRVIIGRPNVTVDMPGAGDLGQRAGEAKPDPEPVAKLSATSGRDGRFRLEGVGPADGLKLSLTHSDHVSISVEVNAFDGVSRDIGDLVLELGGLISGFVTNEAGQPLAGAEVQGRPVEKEGGSFLFEFSSLVKSFSEWKATAGEDGSYTIRGFPPGKAEVRASHPEYGSATKSDIVVARGNETAGADIILPWGLAIAGWVENADGEPLAGAEVVAIKHFEINLDSLSDLESLPFNIVSNLKPAQTDEEGFFRLQGLSEGLYTVKATADSFVAAEKDRVKAGTDEHVLVMHAGGWLVGRIVDARSGAGIESFSIDVTQPGYDEDAHELLEGEAAAAMSAKSLDPGGAFCIQGLGAADFSLAIEADGFADEKVSGVRVTPGKGTARNIELFPESVIAGRLLTAAGEPVAEGRVKLETPKVKTELPVDPAALQEASDLLPGIKGVADLLNDRWNSVKSVESGEDGAFVFRGISAGHYRVMGTHELHAKSEPLELTLDRGAGFEGIEIRLGQAGSIAGTAYAVNGKPLPGGQVQVSKGGGLMGVLASGDNDSPSLGLNGKKTDGEGRFRFDGLAPGAYIVYMQSPGDMESLGGVINSSLSGLMGQGVPGAQKVYVEAGRVSEVELHQTLKSRIEGLVTEAGNAVPGMKMNLLNSDLGFLAIVPVKSTSTDGNGVYFFDELEEGNYDVRLDLRGLTEPLKESVHVTEGEKAILNFALPTGRVAGLVTDIVTGLPLAGMKVSLERTDKKGGGLLSALNVKTTTVDMSGNESDGGNALQSIFGSGPAVTGADGRFEIRFVEAGEYALTVKGKGYVEEKRSPLTIAPDSETSYQEFRLARGFTVSGTITNGATGTTLDHCDLTCERIVKGEAEPEKVKSFQSGTEGRFSLSGLAPGAYRLKGETHGLTGEEVFIIREADVEGLELVLW